MFFKSKRKTTSQHKVWMEVFQRHVATICYLLFREGCTQIILKNSRYKLQFMEAQLEMIKAEALGRKTDRMEVS